LRTLADMLILLRQ